ncbi:Transposase Tc1-like [Trinorchestia longiramus]|nr:Transposase Tc1-like [Trinorchestia longiramus]
MRKSTQQQDACIRRKSVTEPNKNAVQMCKEMATEHRSAMSKEKIKRHLGATALFARVLTKKPFIQEKNRKIRLKFAKEHESWSTKDWKKVFWNKLHLFRSYGQRYVRRPKGTRMDPRYQHPTVKHGGALVMV